MVRQKNVKRIGTMVKSKRRKSSKTLRYFFLNDELHKTLNVFRPDDMLVAWNYPQRKRVAYVLSDCKLHMQRAYGVNEVAEMFGRRRNSIFRYIYNGNIPAPQKNYPLHESTKEGKYFFGEKDIFALHDYLMTVNLGRPRADGERRATNAPSRRELEAMLRNDTMLYVKTSDGEYAPVWKQPDW
ncbi:MAG: hypothetical protein EBU08_03810 [Micrococcales bacterium]|nr:hypothetical protein [Micrococcales bacterium]